MVDCCELLKKYDTNRDGKIDRDELIKAYDDWMNGKITWEEFQIVYDAWMEGSINAVCPGCYEEQPSEPEQPPPPPPTPKKAVLNISTSPSGANVYVDGEYKGIT